jgi:cytochrome c peroxidase
MFPGGVPASPEIINLGQELFSESSISADGRVSCATCHPFDQYAADGLPLSIGNNGRINDRNAPTIFNAADQITQHWIGNRESVEDQAKRAVTGPASFGAPDEAFAVRKMREKESLRDLFRRAFPNDRDPINLENFAKAVGAFERTLVTPAPFDRYLNGENGAISGDAKIGLDLFITTGCTSCHSGPYLGGRMYSKFGIFAPYPEQTHSTKVDTGRFAVTGNDADRFVFKVPPLRNVEKTAPYFHDGSVADLKRTIHVMSRLQLGKNLSESEAEYIQEFLKTLTGEIPRGLQ